MLTHFKQTLIFTILLLTFSCDTGKHYSVIVEFDKVDGLYEKSEVRVSGFKVGYVKTMQLIDNKVTATLYLDNKTKISDKATFVIKNSDLLGTKHIEIENAVASDNYLTDGKKVKGVYDDKIINNTPISVDSLVLKIAKPILDSLGYDVTPKQNK